ncbi:hypothetical protein [Streptomyces sp. NPDC002122]|uniref:hypothetical protein n=1 Tax=Streptomyces sp. NPDC002122 TaxID=3154407 RepID=UPI00332403C8
MDAQQTQDLIKVLLDPKADIGARDDAAMDLYETDAPQARQALLAVACDARTPYIVLASAGESLGQIVTRTGRFLSDQEHAGLTADARHEYDGASTSTTDINDGG